MTTTSVEIDEELQNRCLVLTVNEDREQTKRIHELQRKSRTLEGMLQKENKSSTLNVHANAQRLLKSLMIVNPYAHQLTFLDNRLRARRDNIKYLNLINSIALIHQFQRQVKTVAHQGRRAALYRGAKSAISKPPINWPPPYSAPASMISHRRPESC